MRAGHRRHRRVLMIVDNACHPDPRVAKEAEALVLAGHAVTILAWDRNGTAPARDTLGGADVIRLLVRSGDQRRFAQLLPILKWWRLVFHAARRVGFDALHCHDLPSLPVGVLLGLLTGAPLTYDAHELYWLQDRGKFPAWATASLRRFEALLLRRVDTIVTVSESLAEYFRAHHHSVLVVGNWYDPSTGDSHARLMKRQELGIAPDQFCLVSIGTLSRARMFPLLVDFAERETAVAVVVAGRGGLANDMQMAADRLANFHFLGWTNEPASVYGVADALFYGLDEDDPYSAVSSPNTLFVAISMCIPLVGSPAGAVGEMLATHRIGAVLREPTVDGLASAVDELMDPETHAQAAEALRALHTSYSWSAAAGILRQLYAR